MIDSIPDHLYDTYFLTGSSVICNPPVTDTDIDYMFFTNDYENLYTWLFNNGWKTNEFDYETNQEVNWTSFRKDKYNVLITNDINHYDLFETATKLATKLNLLDKSQRITLFSYITQGEID